jgi:hypothetical protein
MKRNKNRISAKIVPNIIKIRKSDRISERSKSKSKVDVSFTTLTINSCNNQKPFDHERLNCLLSLT